MAYNKASEFPGTFSSGTALSNTPVNVGTGKLSISWGVLIGGAADEVVEFRTQDAVTNHFSVSVPAGAVVPLGGFKIETDLEIVTSTAAGDVGYVLAIASLG